MQRILRRSGQILLALFVCTGLCLGYQFGGMVVPSGPVTSPDVAKANAERIQVAKEALAAIDALVKQGEMARPTTHSRWLLRLIEAQIEAGGANSEPVRSALKKLREVEANAEQGHKNGTISMLDLLDAKHSRIEAEFLVAKHKSASRNPAQAAVLSQNHPAMVGGMGGGNEIPNRKAPKEHPADIARNKFIEEKLETAVTLSFPNETPLEDFIKFIKESVPGQNGKPIPIFISPQGLAEAEKTMTSPISIDLEGVPLRTTLRLVLNQLDLDYRVREGMIFISQQQQFDEEEGNP